MNPLLSAVLKGRTPQLRDTPVEYLRCGVNWNGVKYDVSKIAELNQTFEFTDETNDYHYYVSLCDDLKQMPLGVDAQFGVNGIRMNVDTKFYEPIAFHDTQTYDLFDGTDPESGFVIRTAAQATDPESKFKFYYLTFVFMPGENASVEPSSTFMFEDEEILNIAIQFETSYAKPTKVDPPPAPPLPPTCKKLWNSDKVYPYGIFLNLDDLAFGPHGYPVTFDDDKDTIALYQPCGYSKCPTDFDCGNYTTASAWVCNRSMKCEGFSQPKVDFKMLHEDPDEGIRVDYQGLDDNTVTVDTLCDFELRSGLVYINSADLKDPSTLHIRMHSNSACMQPLEQVQPTGCQAHLNDSQYAVDVDLTKYNQDDGWRFDVTNEKFNASKHWAVVQPCAALGCPGDDCGDSTGATVWLCENNADGSSKCLDYGLFRNSVTVESYLPTTISKGISINYKGSNNRNTHIRLQCNWTGTPGELAFSSNLDSQSGGISLYAYSRDVCVGPEPKPVPTQTPSPTPSQTLTPGPETPTPTPAGWYPPEPQPTQSPKPIGQTQPTIYIANETHSIMADLMDFTYSKDVTIKYGTQKASAKLQFYPFNSKNPPAQYQPKGLYSADAWLCWESNCYPMMKGTEYGISYNNKSRNLQSVTFTANSFFDTVFEVTVKCNENAKNPVSDQIVNFDGNNKYSITTEWSQICPRTEIQPVFPPEPVTPTPAPAPQPYPISYADEEYSYDFSNLGQSTVSMRVQVGLSYEDTVFSFDPDGLIECPIGSECRGVEKATAWKCWEDAVTKKMSCLALADVRYAPQSITASSVVYNGGYGGYQLEMMLNCNPDASDNNYTLSEVAFEENEYVTVNLFSKAFCTGRGIKRNSATGGAVFLLILILISISYIIIGVTYNFIKHGVIAIPGQGFFNEFASCVATGFSYVICRKQIVNVGQASATYDTI